MSEVDPYKVMRSSATLQAWRDHQRAAWAAGQPWLAMSIAIVPVQITLLAYVLLSGHFRRFGWFPLLLMLAWSVSFFVGMLRTAAFKRAHPFVLPEPVPITRPAGASPRDGRPIRNRIPLNGFEVAAICVTCFCLGAAVGAFTAAAPTPPTPRQWTEILSFQIVGMIIFICLSIHRINKEWKFRTTQSPTE